MKSGALIPLGVEGNRTTPRTPLALAERGALTSHGSNAQQRTADAPRSRQEPFSGPPTTGVGPQTPPGLEGLKTA